MADYHVAGKVNYERDELEDEHDAFADPAMQRQADNALLEEDDPWLDSAQ